MKKQSDYGPKERQNDRPTDIVNYRVACTRLKKKIFPPTALAKNMYDCKQGSTASKNSQSPYDPYGYTSRLIPQKSWSPTRAPTGHPMDRRIETKIGTL